MSEVKESKKRDLKEIEIDLAQAAPLSKKQKRLLRKGKLDLGKLEQEQKKEAEKLLQASKKEEEGDNKDQAESDEEDNSESRSKSKSKKEKGEQKFGVWIGNLTFDTEKDDIIRFICNKTNDYAEYSTELSDDEPCQVNEQDFLRMNIPTQGGANSKKIKGFAYVDFPTRNHQLAVIKLSESQLNGRNMLIKDSKSYEGRPTKEDVEMKKNPPSRILFVGNLSFDTTQDLLTQQFQHCGEIVKIRMATFEDTGKCKGFAFIDFRDETGPTKALSDKSCRKLMNRNLRMEFGEDRSKRAPRTNRPLQHETQNESLFSPVPQQPQQKFVEHEAKPIRERPLHDRKPKKPFNKKSEVRQVSSVALATAQRGSAAIVKSTGKKVTFD